MDRWQTCKPASGSRVAEPQRDNAAFPGEVWLVQSQYLGTGTGLCHSSREGLGVKIAYRSCRVCTAHCIWHGTAAPKVCTLASTPGHHCGACASRPLRSGMGQALDGRPRGTPILACMGASGPAAPPGPGPAAPPPVPCPLQGVHIRRHRIKKPDGRFYEPRDFVVGGNVAMYGRTFHITDADAFTRGFLQDQVGASSTASPPHPQKVFSFHTHVLQRIR